MCNESPKCFEEQSQLNVERAASGNHEKATADPSPSPSQAQGQGQDDNLLFSSARGRCHSNAFTATGPSSPCLKSL
jgi:hypothetical protein